MKNRYKIALGFLVSLVFIYFAFRRVGLAEILYSLNKANYFWVLPNMAAVILTMFLRAVRWHYLLHSLRNFNVSQLFPSVMIGFMANNVLPVRLGEVVRAYSLGATSGESRSSIFATIVLERVFDSLVLLAMFWMVILFIPFPAPIKKFGLVTLFLNIGIIIFLVLLKNKANLITGLIVKFFFFLPSGFGVRLEYILSRFVEGLSLFKNFGNLFKVVAWSVVIWTITALSNYFVFMAFGYYPNIAASFILLIFVAAAVTLPSAPGFIGVFQAGTIAAFGFLNSLNLLGNQLTWSNAHQTALAIPALSTAPALGIGFLSDSLGLFGIPKSEALSFSIVLWLCLFLPVTLLGFYYLKREHLSLKDAQIGNPTSHGRGSGA